MNRLNFRNIGILFILAGGGLFFYVVGKIIGWLEISAAYCVMIGIILMMSDRGK